MSLESTNTIAGLVSTNPTVQDPVHDGARHFWLIKNVLKSIFPGKDGQGFSKPITASEDELNYVSGVTSPIQGQLDAILNRMYPVGSIYCNATNSESPKYIIGVGEWVKFGAGRMVVGQQDADPLFATPESTGGSRDSVVVAHDHGTAVTGGTDLTHNHGGSTVTGGVDHIHTGTTNYMDANNIHSHTSTMDAQGVHSHVYVRGSSPGSGVAGGTSSPGDGFSPATEAAGGHVHNISVAAADINHRHTFATGGARNGSDTAEGYLHNHSINNALGVHTHNVTMSSAGVAGTDKNLPPYITVYMWKRVS